MRVAMVGLSSEEYLEKNNVQEAISKAVSEALQARPDNALQFIGELLISSAAKVWKLGGPAVGTPFPNVGVDIGFLGLDPNNKKMTGDLNAGKKTLWVGLPGAFTPT